MAKKRKKTRVGRGKGRLTAIPAQHITRARRASRDVLAQLPENPDHPSEVALAQALRAAIDALNKRASEGAMVSLAPSSSPPPSSLSPASLQSSTPSLTPSPTPTPAQTTTVTGGAPILAPSLLTLRPHVGGGVELGGVLVDITSLTVDQLQSLGQYPDAVIELRRRGL